MALTHQLVTLNASTATILTIPFANEPAYSKTLSVSIQNLNTVTVYLGGIGVTSSSYGHALRPGATFTADLEASDDMYAIAASGTSNVAVMQVQH